MAKGEVTVEPLEIQRVIMDYYSNLFGSSLPQEDVIEEIISCLEPKVTEEMNLELLLPFTSEEVKQALDEMHPLKSPGPDVGYLRPGRGLRQGDPLSPYLFLSCAEAFSGLVRQAEEGGSIRGVRVCRHGRRVSHLLFADDTLIFCDAKSEAVIAIREVQNWNLWLQSFSGTRTAIEKSIGYLGPNCAKVKRTGVKLHYQNLALLSKQAWRLVTRPQGLVNLVLRNKYFPNGDFFNAQCGSNPSFIWRSILASRTLLTAGIRWEVGDENLIKVEGDPWLPRPPTFRLISRPKSLLGNASVSRLLGADRNWNQVLINEEFDHIDAECILQIVPRTAPSPDAQIWHFGTKGKFSVSSAYGVFQNSVVGASSSTKRMNAGGKGHWHFIWGAKVPPKVRLFAWQSCKNALPTQSNLAARKIHLENVCLCCDQEEDSLAHILRRCSFSRLVWALSHIPWIVVLKDDLSIEEWMRFAHSQLGLGGFERFLPIVWLLWGNRNSRI
ncbi:UNVERIFIED_CONTAM: hypothetical protein Sradi_2085000 [Sesamum radiatum]|uniref:Reverse transcriptase domain-containing protein n=1 Tax=Sesamum radiatum TaxID=300843 RepID=A0AAW2TIQ2_SESRA